MRKFFASVISLTLFTLISVAVFTPSAELAAELAVSPHLVISQFQVAGGNANDEFVEIHNTGSNPIDLSGYKLVYRSSGGTNDVLLAQWSSVTVIPAGGYYMVASTGYDGSAAPDLSYNPSTCSCSMSGTTGGIGIRQGSVNTGVIIDSVGYGSATNVFVEGTVTPFPAANTSQSRNNNACQDTDNNLNDFSNTNPAAPKNASSTPNVCGGGGTTMLAGMAANPTHVVPGGNTLLTVTVLPATDPPSTGITVVGNFANIGGAASQPLFDDGTNGDAAPGDNTFSFLAVIPANSAGGARVITAVASDAQARSVNLTQNITINAPLPNDDPLLFGNPSNATGDIANENNYLMQKPQYSLSYNRSKATANWVAWRVDSSWIGPGQRQDDFRPDTTLPAGWYQVTDQDYSGSGYDRGHMCPSGDRTRSNADNSATFLMTNMIPQLGANNQGPWNDFEIYLRTLAGQGKEIYIISGPTGNIGTIAQGRVVVPAVTWKVVLIIPSGDNDVARVNRATRAFGIIVPNQPPISSVTWRPYRVTVDAVENLTGYDFFSQIPRITQELIEKKRDRE